MGLAIAKELRELIVHGRSRDRRRSRATVRPRGGDDLEEHVVSRGVGARVRAVKVNVREDRPMKAVGLYVGLRVNRTGIALHLVAISGVGAAEIEWVDLTKKRQFDEVAHFCANGRARLWQHRGRAGLLTIRRRLVLPIRPHPLRGARDVVLRDRPCLSPLLFWKCEELLLP